MKKQEQPNLGERALFLLSPERGNKKFLERIARERQADQKDLLCQRAFCQGSCARFHALFFLFQS